ncbi:SMC family protein [Coprobacter fastidiosus]|uniref:hypothetical protein n=1 Tax=Coprobacter fastidiosus TaxID=1099853 RepID=UPI00033891B4|nr:hypothetical protein [Coprobacter fastidiosus]CDD90060.1 putative uncharacterized protein [Tannerella sp. CAG:51]
MEKGNLSSSSFSYKDYNGYNRKFNEQNYILVVKDEDFPDKNVISILHRDGQMIEDIDEYDMGNKIFIVKDRYNQDVLSLGERFAVNQLFKIASGNVIYNSGSEENPNFPKVKTFHSNLSEILNNEIIEIFEGEISEAKSTFSLKEDILKPLLSDNYVGLNNCFFITEDNKTMKGPFVAKKKDSEERFVIRKSEYLRFGEYEMKEKSFVAFSANDVDRRIFIPGVNELPSPHIIDFISDEDLLKEFERRVKGSSNDYNIDVLNSFIEFIQRFRSEINDNTSVRRNERLLAIIDAGKNEILSNIDFIDRLPQMKFVRDEINKLSEKRLQLNTEIDRLKIQEERLQQNIEKENQEFESLKQDKENFREQELINKKTILEAEITELEERKNNLSSFVSVEEERLSKELATITDDIRWKQKSKQELEYAIQNLRKEFVNKQIEEQEQLKELIQHKKYFDFLSGRDLSTYNINDEVKYPDLRIKNEDVKYEDYVSFRNQVLEILARNNRKVDSHFLDNLLISIHQNTLTLLAGLPGTGKTSLAKLLVNILASTEKIREVSVSRGWTSSKDLIGFFNPLTKRFTPSSTGIYPLLKQLDYECKNNLFKDSSLAYVILDEANLSPLEHYWSIFYNLTDSKVDEDKYFNLDLGGTEHLRYANNLRFIGTINYDQTTEELSPRVIDRANIIRLKPENFNIDNLICQDIKKVLLRYKDIIDYFELLDFKDELNVAFDDEREQLFRDIKDKFRKLNIYVSPRVEISIKRYCNVAKKIMHEENRPLDYAIAQRLLPLINVQGIHAKQKLKELQEKLPEEKFSISASILKDIISLGEEGEIYENQFNYFLTLSHA